MTRILQLQDSYKKKWDEYVNRSSHGTFFHLTSWKDMIEKTFGLRSFYLMAVNGEGDIEGILPLILKRDIFGRKYIISNSFSTYAGVCAEDDAVKNALLSRAKEIAVRERVQYVEIRQLAEKIYDLPTVRDFAALFLELANDDEYVWKNAVTAKARNQVRKAYKEGLTIDFGHEYLDDFYNVLSINIRDLGSPNYPKMFLKNILDEYGDASNIIVVKYKDKVIGGMFFIIHKDVFFDPWASSLKQYNRLCPNDILYWEAIKYACRKGCKYFDFGRSPVNSGTYKFKKKWGAEPMQIYYQYYLNKAQKPPLVNTDDNKYQIVIDLWKKLPLCVAGAIGTRLIKYVPEL